MITLEGFNWSNDWSLFDQPFDSNVCYQFHYYCWNRPDNLNSIDEYIKKRSQLNTPIWVGETGEKGNAIYWATTQLFEASNIGFSFWPWKKMDTKNTPYSINKPSGWDMIAAYTNGGAKPDAAVAEKAFNELLENIKLRRCHYFKDVNNAIMTRIPAKIEAENYGQNGFNRSWFVMDTITKSKFYRTSEPVKINLDSKEKDLLWSEQSIALQSSEWVVYNFNNLDNVKHHLSIRASAGLSAKLIIEINAKKANAVITSNEFSETSVGDYQLKKGMNTVKVFVLSGTVNLDWIRFE
jgi:hypothetical protein